LDGGLEETYFAAQLGILGRFALDQRGSHQMKETGYGYDQPLLNLLHEAFKAQEARALTPASSPLSAREAALLHLHLPCSLATTKLSPKSGRRRTNPKQQQQQQPEKSSSSIQFSSKLCMFCKTILSLSLETRNL
jgi:hypothetical protein